MQGATFVSEPQCYIIAEVISVHAFEFSLAENLSARRMG